MHFKHVRPSFDAPISYTYPNQEKVVRELIRIARKRIMVSVSSRLGALPYFANPLQKEQFFLNKDSKNGWVHWHWGNRDKLIGGFRFLKGRCEEMPRRGLIGNGEQKIAQYQAGGIPWPITYHFLPDELKRILEGCGVSNVELAGPGAYARTVPNELLVRIMQDGAQRAEFLDFCYQFDRNPFVCGMEKDNLFAKGEIAPAAAGAGEAT